MRMKSFRRAVFGLVAAAAVLVPSAAPAGSTATITISHQVRGCHAWSFNSGPIRPTLSVTVARGTVLKFVNNDVMPQLLIQTAGPKVRIVHPNMDRMASTAKTTLTKKGLYRFKAKAGPYYKWVGGGDTVGKDFVLRLTVRAK